MLLKSVWVAETSCEDTSVAVGAVEGRPGVEVGVPMAACNQPWFVLLYQHDD